MLLHSATEKKNSGGHAQRLWNLMQDQKSEYAVWISTSSRPGTSLPLFYDRV